MANRGLASTGVAALACTAVGITNVYAQEAGSSSVGLEEVIVTAQRRAESINEVGLYQYLEKPWDNQQLLLVIQSAIERTHLFRSLREKIAQLDSAHSNLKDVQARLLQAFL